MNINAPLSDHLHTHQHILIQYHYIVSLANAAFITVLIMDVFSSLTGRDWTRWSYWPIWSSGSKRRARCQWRCWPCWSPCKYPG